MTETCGYRLLPDEIAKRTGARRVSKKRSPVGWRFKVSVLAYQYERCGLNAVIAVSPMGMKIVKSATCKICGVFDESNTRHADGHYLQCNAEKHRAYYDSFLSVE